MNKGYIALWVLGLILLVLDLSIVISLFRKGDERRQIIVWKSSTFTFSILIGVLIMESVVTLISGAFNISTNNFNNGSSTFSLLTLTAVVYFISLKYNQKKYGD